MPSSQSDYDPASFFQNTAVLPKFFDGSFNSNKTNFGGKAMFTGNDAINLLNSRPVQPSAKLLDNWFSGNRSSICPTAKSMNISMMRPM